MDFANESYVRVYTRDTMTWKRLNWQARCVWSLLLRKLDRAGVLDLEGLQPDEAVALATELPPDVVEVGLPQLFDRGVIEAHDDLLVAPRFLEAQECVKSDKQRAKEYRERRRSQAMAEPSQNVTPESRDVTQSSREITAVTDRHASVTLNSAVLPSALPGIAVPYAVVTAAEKIGRAWYAELVQKDVASIPSASAAYEFIGKQSAEERATVAANLRASSVHGKKLRALNPKRIVDSLWHSHLLSEQEHAAQKQQYANGRQQLRAAEVVPSAHQPMKLL